MALDHEEAIKDYLEDRLRNEERQDGKDIVDLFVLFVIFAVVMFLSFYVTSGAAFAGDLDWHPTIKLAHERIEQAKTARQAELAKWAPSVELDGSFGWGFSQDKLNGSPDPSVFDTTREWSVTLTQPLASSFTLFEGLARADKAERAAALDLEVTERDLKARMSIAGISLGDSLAQIAAIKAARDKIVALKREVAGRAAKDAAAKDELADMTARAARMASDIQRNDSDAKVAQVAYAKEFSDTLLPIEQAPMPTCMASLCHQSVPLYPSIQAALLRSAIAIADAHEAMSKSLPSAQLVGAGGHLNGFRQGTQTDTVSAKFVVRVPIAPTAFPEYSRLVHEAAVQKAAASALRLTLEADLSRALAQFDGARQELAAEAGAQVAAADKLHALVALHKAGKASAGQVADAIEAALALDLAGLASRSKASSASIVIERIAPTSL